MQIIITGAAGFIGSNLAARLLNEGYSVVGIDNFSYGKHENLRFLLKHKNFSFIEGDLLHESVYEQLKGDVIIHLASQKIPRYSSASKTLQDNSRILSFIIDKCKKDNQRLLYASTSDIYGKNPDTPYHEESNIVLGPPTIKRWAYALSKIYGEQLIMANHQDFNLQFTIFRLFGSYGPNQNTTWWGGPQAVFIQNILEGKPLEIHGDGLQTRTFTYIDDTIEGIFHCLKDPRAQNEIFNIAGNPEEEISIISLAKKIWYQMKGLNSFPQIAFIPYTSFGNYEDVKKRVPCINKIMKFGYRPQWTLDKGLEKTIEWQISRNKYCRA
ncbi:NAD(P)-dependent oxidoreductase [Emticicia sp. BO119]|uniref:NAD-dependent epimerase/dehydratase family protein n=1 Tax=Emticicia sp. BO119 TaxID=2757768 RepID=UPI0015F00303|nr:NAD(P)-dependent oxidoreductase [Emticicia sp. BO119]MBA4852567.1 NAD(P)-dependent oxidoreductase [Emticicia sp. BO119]